LRGGLVLMVVGLLIAWGPLDDLPAELGYAVLVVGGLLLAVALGIRSMQG
jgi:hypothetical protein